jgi:hypothetical protein
MATQRPAQGANRGNRAPQTPERNPDVKFMSIQEFKEAIGATRLEVLRNPNTDKLFMSANGQNYRVQGDLDPDERMVVLVEADDLDNACLINGGGAEVLATL